MLGETHSGSRMDIEELTLYMSTTVYSAARDALGMSGQSKWKCKTVDKLEKPRQLLASLLQLTVRLRNSDSSDMGFSSDRQWSSRYDKCNRMLQPTHI